MALSLRSTSVFILLALGFGLFMLVSSVFGAAVTCTDQYNIAVTGTDETACGNVPGAKFCSNRTGPPALPEGCYLPGAGTATTIGGALGLVNKITNWLVAILVLLGIFYGIMGAFEFLSSGGDDKKLTEGKKKIYYAVGGVALGLLVKGIITLLVNFIGTLGA